MSSLFIQKVYRLARDLVPPFLFPRVVHAAVAFKYYLNPVSKDESIEELPLLRRSDEAFIIATGPSLKNVDLSFLEGKDVFSVSNFFLHEQINIISPLLHFFAPYHEPLVLSEYIEWLRMADQNLPPDTRIILGQKSKPLITKSMPFSSNRKIHYLWLEKSQIGRHPSLSKPILGGQSSPLMVLPVLIAMGYRFIYLLGCDHNVLKNYGGVVQNFYKPEDDPRNNATSGNNWQDGIIKHLDYAQIVFKQYKYYQDQCESMGISIFNMSQESWVDFIEFCSVEDYLISHNNSNSIRSPSNYLK